VPGKPADPPPEHDSTAAPGRRPDPAGKPSRDPAGEPSPGAPSPGRVGDPDAGQQGQGLSWSFELDLEALLSAIGGSRAGDLADLQGPRREDDPDGQEMSLAAEWDVIDGAVGKPRDLTGVIADQLPAGPAWPRGCPTPTPTS
jgi:hypothetical protein